MRNTSSLITRLTLAYCKHRDEARKPGTGMHICVSGGGGGELEIIHSQTGNGTAQHLI